MAERANPKQKRSKGTQSAEAAAALTVKKVVSGGQTGVDRAALDAAIVLGIPHGGWCPHGRLAEDGRIPVHYKLQETESRRYYVRTELNVKDADGTLILYRRQLTGGTALTRRCAEQYHKSLLCIDLLQLSNESQLAHIRDWLQQNQIRVLNIAGPRESTAPGIAAAARSLLLQALQRPRRSRSSPEK